jgi:hypothetical protein
MAPFSPKMKIMSVPCNFSRLEDYLLIIFATIVDFTPTQIKYYLLGILVRVPRAQTNRTAKRIPGWSRIWGLSVWFVGL